jgi:uncharacterized protein GlcG (DUF336 family)
MGRNALVKWSAAALILGIASAAATAQGLITQKVLSLDLAETVARGALEKCRADGYRTSITIVDASGVVKIAMRDDGVSPHTVDVSRRKAYTAMIYRRSTAETLKGWQATPPPAPNIEGTIALAGGVPIRAGNEILGGLGVSGAPGGDKDEACANAGLAKAAEVLK